MIWSWLAFLCLLRDAAVASFDDNVREVDLVGKSLLWPIPKSFVSEEGELCVASTPEIVVKGVDSANTEMMNRKIDEITEILSKAEMLEYCKGSSVLRKFEMAVTDDQAFGASLIENETFEMRTEKEVLKITAKTSVGLFHALTTFENLMELQRADESEAAAVHGNIVADRCLWYVTVPFKSFNIKDGPRYSHRGLMIDTTRNYMTLQVLMRVVTSMSVVKMNVLHLLVSDGPSVPLAMPETAKVLDETVASTRPLYKAAFSDYEVYTETEMTKLYKYAKDRAVRLYIEIAGPNHANAWSESASHLNQTSFFCNTFRHQCITYCPEPPCSIADAAAPVVENITKALVTDIASIYESTAEQGLLYVGGQHFTSACAPNGTLDRNVLQYYQYVQTLLQSRGLHPVYSSEVLQAGHPPSIVQVTSTANQAAEVIKDGGKVILSLDQNGANLHCGRAHDLLLNRLSPCSFASWWDNYLTTPHLQIPNARENSKNILGGEAILRSSTVSHLQAENYIWPRTAALAGALWEDREKLPEITDTKILTQALTELYTFVYNIKNAYRAAVALPSQLPLPHSSLTSELLN